MANLPGAFPAVKKNGEAYYRASVTYKNRHLSLGSFNTEKDASAAYKEAVTILSEDNVTEPVRDELGIVDEYLSKQRILSFNKWIMLKNYKDNNMYCRNPIYLRNRYFIYFLDISTPLKFDAEDLFYYMSHKIMRRGGHLFVADYGMQVNIFLRYGIKNHAVQGKDYRFINGDITDFRYGNIEILNRYYGVSKIYIKGRYIYLVKIHINGDYIVGRYNTETEAAVAYNKAADILRKNGVTIRYQENYIESIDEIEYAKIYNSVRINKKVRYYQVSGTGSHT